MRRIFHPYTIWEDYLAGMWSDVSAQERRRLLPLAVKFTGDAKLYGSFMLRVIQEWPISSEHNLSDIAQNRRAWVGHAACCLAIRCPEYITREAWGFLNQNQQIDANAEASNAIREWERMNETENTSIRSQMEKTGIPGRIAGSSTKPLGKGEQSSVISLDMQSDYDERSMFDESGDEPSEM